jgi:hypothetical protein
MFLTTCGYLLTLANIMLIDTRFAIAGIGFGVVAAGFFIAALRIKK